MHDVDAQREGKSVRGDVKPDGRCEEKRYSAALGTAPGFERASLRWRMRELGRTQRRDGNTMEMPNED